MKRLILSVCTLTTLTLMTIVSHAQETVTAPPATSVQQQVTQPEDQKVKVELTALPDGIKKTLASDSFKDWTASSAWQIKSNTAEYYLIEMKKGEETTTLKLDSNGNKVG